MASAGDLTSRHQTGHVPLMPSDQVERIQRWHEDAYENARAQAGTDGQIFDYLGLTLHVPPQVQPITGMSHLLGEAVLAEVRPDDRVLDMGTGSGVNAILAARAAREVVAVDINPYAVTAARDNAARNGVADRVEVKSSDVFSDVEGGFDLVIFDPPFRWFAPRDLLEAATTDAGYSALTRFFHGVRDYLTLRGRLLVFFGSSADLAYLEQLADEQGLRREVITRQSLVKDGWRVDYLTYRLTP